MGLGDVYKRQALAQSKEGYGRAHRTKEDRVLQENEEKNARRKNVQGLIYSDQTIRRKRSAESLGSMGTISRKK